MRDKRRKPVMHSTESLNIIGGEYRQPFNRANILVDAQTIHICLIID
jgi:hypothetical protein